MARQVCSLRPRPARATVRPAAMPRSDAPTSAPRRSTPGGSLRWALPTRHSVCTRLPGLDAYLRAVRPARWPASYAIPAPLAGPLRSPNLPMPDVPIRDVAMLPAPPANPADPRPRRRAARRCLPGRAPAARQAGGSCAQQSSPVPRKQGSIAIVLMGAYISQSATRQPYRQHESPEASHHAHVNAFLLHFPQECPGHPGPRALSHRKAAEAVAVRPS